MRRYDSVGSLRKLLEGLDSIELSQDKEYFWASVNIIVKSVLNDMWIIFSCSRKILLHTVR
jgi:hypothetical protein